jgi:hypothetical protein
MGLLQNQSSHTQCATYVSVYAASQTLSVARPYIVEWQNDRWTGKDLEGSDRSLNEVLSQHLPGGTEEKLRKTSVSTAGDTAEIRNKHLPYTSPEH